MEVGERQKFKAEKSRVIAKLSEWLFFARVLDYALGTVNLRKSETTPDKHMLSESVQGRHIEYVEYQEVDGKSSFYGGNQAFYLLLL